MTEDHIIKLKKRTPEEIAASCAKKLDAQAAEIEKWKADFRFYCGYDAFDRIKELESSLTSLRAELDEARADAADLREVLWRIYHHNAAAQAAVRIHYAHAVRLTRAEPGSGAVPITDRMKLPCTICGGPRDWARDGEIQTICYACGGKAQDRAVCTCAIPSCEVHPDTRVIAQDRAAGCGHEVPIWYCTPDKCMEPEWIGKVREKLRFIVERENLTFAECTDAENIIQAAQDALALLPPAAQPSPTSEEK